jgi:hypothetical protein
MSMDELITAGAGLLGALIGLGGALAVSNRAVMATREQARYTRLHERRDEILATLHGYLMEIHDAFRDMVFESADNSQEKLQKEGQVIEAMQRAWHYERRHLLWLLDDTTEVFDHALDAYQSWYMRLHRLAQEASREGQYYHDQTYKEEEDRAKEWLTHGAGENLAAVNTTFRQHLGTDPYEQSTTNHPWWRKVFGG